MSICDEVAAIFKRETEHKGQLDGLQILLDQVFPTSNQVDSFKLLTLVETVVNLETGSMVVSRQFISAVINRLNVSDLDSCITKEIVMKLLDILQPRSISYEDHTCNLRMKSADILEKEQNYLAAAQALIGITPESMQRNFTTVEDKKNLHIRIGQLLLQVGRIVEAESYINKANMMQDGKDEVSVELKVIYAKLFDLKRRFADAAQRYYECSLVQAIGKSDCAEALANAIKCTILACPGVQRTRMLSTLYKDERTSVLPSFELLQKLFLDRLVKPNELLEFEKGLAEHQLQDDKGCSIVQSVILEHNMTAVSRLYYNVSFNTLAQLLGVDEDKAEEIAVNMIATDRLTGQIDQIDGFVHFKRVDMLVTWDKELLEICQQVNRVSDLISTEHPQLASK